MSNFSSTEPDKIRDYISSYKRMFLTRSTREAGDYNTYFIKKTNQAQLFILGKAIRVLLRNSVVFYFYFRFDLD